MDMIFITSTICVCYEYSLEAWVLKTYANFMEY